MLHFLKDLDYLLFEFINVDLSNGFFDVVLVAWRDKYLWLPFYVFIISFLIFNFRKNAYLILVFACLTVTTTDIISSRVVKKVVERQRPCNSLVVSNMLIKVPCGSGYSFTSSHAANHFGIALFFIFTVGKRIRKIKWPLLIWAGLVALAQVYVGVHFPSDVFFGSILGLVIAFGWSSLYNQYFGHVFKTSEKHNFN